MKSDYESLGPYSPLVLGSRPIRLTYLRDVLKRVIHEAEDAQTTGEMFEPYAKIVNFVQANRKIQEQVRENPNPTEEE